MWSKTKNVFSNIGLFLFWLLITAVNVVGIGSIIGIGIILGIVLILLNLFVWFEYPFLMAVSLIVGLVFCYMDDFSVDVLIMAVSSYFVGFLMSMCLIF